MLDPKQSPNFEKRAARYMSGGPSHRARRFRSVHVSKSRPGIDGRRSPTSGRPKSSLNFKAFVMRVMTLFMIHLTGLMMMLMALSTTFRTGRKKAFRKPWMPSRMLRALKQYWRQEVQQCAYGTQVRPQQERHRNPLQRRRRPHPGQLMHQFQQCQRISQ